VAAGGRSDRARLDVADDARLDVADDARLDVDRPGLRD
jgi:hypothetical protein